MESSNNSLILFCYKLNPNFFHTALSKLFCRYNSITQSLCFEFNLNNNHCFRRSEFDLTHFKSSLISGYFSKICCFSLKGNYQRGFLFVQSSVLQANLWKTQNEYWLH